MAKSGKSKSSAFPSGRRRIHKSGKRLAPRAVRRKTDARFMEECDEGVTQRISGIPHGKQSAQSRSW